MTSYTRRQLALLLLFVGAAGSGLAVGRWRQTHADLVEAFETFDQTPADAPSVTQPFSRRSASSQPPSSKQSRPAPERGENPTEPVDVNHATAADLRRLPGIGPVLATRIVEARETGGPFASIDDLRRVSGIGQSKLERVRSLVTVSR